jgi:hypothetical protein
VHLFCEILVRLEAVGLANDHSGPLPLTYTKLGLFNECLLSASALWPRNGLAQAVGGMEPEAPTHLLEDTEHAAVVLRSLFGRVVSNRVGEKAPI